MTSYRPVLLSLYWLICGSSVIPTKDPRGVDICQKWTMAVSGIPGVLSLYLLFENAFQCCMKGEKLSTPLDKDGRDSRA